MQAQIQSACHTLLSFVFIVLTSWAQYGWTTWNHGTSNKRSQYCTCWGWHNTYVKVFLLLRQTLGASGESPLGFAGNLDWGWLVGMGLPPVPTPLHTAGGSNVVYGHSGGGMRMQRYHRGKRRRGVGYYRRAGMCGGARRGVRCVLLRRGAWILSSRGRRRRSGTADRTWQRPWLVADCFSLPLSLSHSLCSLTYCCCAPSGPRCGAVCSARGGCINHGGAARRRAQRGSLRRASASHEMCLQVREAPHSCRYNASSHSLHSPCLSILL